MKFVVIYPDEDKNVNKETYEAEDLKELAEKIDVPLKNKGVIYFSEE